MKKQFGSILSLASGLAKIMDYISKGYSYKI
jgi:hypothetical protein